MGENNGLIGYGAFFCEIPVKFLQMEDFSVGFLHDFCKWRAFLSDYCTVFGKREFICRIPARFLPKVIKFVKKRGRKRKKWRGTEWDNGIICIFAEVL